MSSSEFLHKLVNTSTSKIFNFLIGSVHLGLESDSLDCSFWSLKVNYLLGAQI